MSEGEGGGGEMAKILSGDVAPEENPFQHPAVIACDWVAFIAVSPVPLVLEEAGDNCSCCILRAHIRSSLPRPGR